jgi:GT2 family glycosyltransferase
MIKIAVLITCYNRREKTLACLNTLFNQQRMVGFEFMVYVVDAGDDQTSQAVAVQFPDVQLLRGDASTFWAGGMRQAWRTALDANNDFYLWLNDDVQLLPDALARLLTDYQHLMSQSSSQPPIGAVVGTMAAQDRIVGTTPIPTYGGRRRVSTWFPLSFGPVVPPSEQPQRCDFINGNLCLIPAAAVQAIGILSDRFTHSMADYDYGLRLQAAGYSLWLGSGFHGICPHNDPALSVLNKKRPFRARLDSLRRPNVWAPATEWSYFVRCHGGPFWPLLWCKVQLRALCPALWLWWSQREIS